MPTGTVKFFNPIKGFGFIAPSDGRADIFVHVSAVERAGLSGLNEGDEVSFEVEQDRRTNKQSAADLQMIREGAPGASAGRGAPRQSFGDRGGDRGGGDRFDRGGGGPRGGGGGGGGGFEKRAVTGSGAGTVKWFNGSKGFGFIKPDDGGADVFVHVTALERAGLHGLDEGERVGYDLEADSRSGKSSAVNLRLER